MTVGTGAVGAFYGSRLALAKDTNVSVTCRSNYDAVRKNGLNMTTHTFGDYHFQPHACYPSIQAAVDSHIKFDYIVVTTKALPDVTDDSLMIEPLISPHSSIVLIQNGVGVEEPHRQRFDSTPILSAVTVVSAAQTEPGTIKQNRWTRISIGPYLGDGATLELERKSTKENTRFVELLQQGGIADAEDYDEKALQLVRWHKLAVRCVVVRNDYSKRLFETLM
jgi:2-dehydropantoate 2-reductase